MREEQKGAVKNRAFSKEIIKNFIENTLFFIYLEKNIWQISPCS